MPPEETNGRAGIREVYSLLFGLEARITEHIDRAVGEVNSRLQSLGLEIAATSERVTKLERAREQNFWPRKVSGWALQAVITAVMATMVAVLVANHVH